MRQLLRQGDVLLMPVEDTALLYATSAKSPKGGIVVAQGEATGHHHRIRSRHARLYRRGQDRFIKVHNCAVKERPRLTHEEHDPVTLEPGVYQVVLQREYTPSAPVRVYD